MDRRSFLRTLPAAAGIPLAMRHVQRTARPAPLEVMTVRGRVDADALGFTLMHEHLLVSFQPYTERAVRPLPYDANEVVLALPGLVEGPILSGRRCYPELGKVR